MGFPFTFFRHGAVNTDSKLKNAETYVVFTRDPTAAERKAIEETCPAPVAGMFTWGDRFAYFGSAGDTFDFEVLEQYGGPAVKKLFAAQDYVGAMKNMDAAMVAFVEAYDAWLAETHAKVPIAFTEAPTSTEEDAWGEWSMTRADDALAALSPIRSTKKELQWVAARVNEMLADAPPDASKTDVRAKAAAAQLEALEIPIPIERLTTTEHEIHTAGQALGAVLAKTKKGERAKVLAALSPKAKLVYYASYTAGKNGDLALLGDVEKALDAIVRALPEHDHWRAAQLVAFIAENIAHTTPAYDKPDPKGAKAALPIFKQAIAFGARDEQTFDYAMTCARAAKDKATFIAFANEGIDATRSPAVAGEAVKLAKAFKDARATKAFEKRLAGIQASSKIAQSGDGVRMGKQLARGEPTPDLLGNLAARWGNDKKADKKAVQALVAQMAETLSREPAFGMHRAVAENFGVLAGNHRMFEDVVDVLDVLFARGLEVQGSVALTYSYSGAVTKKAATKKKVAARLVAADPSEQNGLTYENVATIQLDLKNEAGAIEALRHARGQRHPYFAKLHKEKAFAPLRGNADFEALFEAEGNAP